MSRDLPQLPSTVLGRDLAAAAALMSATPLQLQQLQTVAADLGTVVDPVLALAGDLVVEPLPPLLPPVDQPPAVAGCVCAPGLICDEGRCEYCRALDPDLPCPHDTFVDAAETVQRFAAVHGLDPAAVAVENLEVLPPAASCRHCPHGLVEHNPTDGWCGRCRCTGQPVSDVVDQDPPADVDRGIGCWPPVDVVHYVAAQQLAAAGVDVVVDWPAVQGQALVDVADKFGPGWQDKAAASLDAAVAASRPSTGHLPALDWRGRHDVRSLAFGVARKLGSAPLQLADVVLPVGPTLDQGSSKGCTGYSLADAINVLDLAAGDIDGKLLTATDADALYLGARRHDQFPGEADAGSSVLGALQAAVEAGLIGGYLWCFGTRDIARTLLSRRPVVLGLTWLSGMFDTGPGGLLTVAGEDIGMGHAIDCAALRLKGPQGQPGPYFGLHGTWPGFGDADGFAWLHHRDLAQLLRGTGEAAVPTVEAQR